jgi:C1A family cysteine protease
MNEMLGHKLGWLGPEPKDKKDFMFMYQRGVKLPLETHNRQFCTQVYNQLNLGSCGGNAGVSLLEYARNKAGLSYISLSRLYAYFQARLIEGTVGRDAGCFIRDVMKGGAKPGIATEALWPYDVNKFRTNPTDEANASAPEHKFMVYRKIYGWNAMKACYASGNTCIFGFTVRPSFETITGDGIMPMPGLFEKILGGHAVHGVDYKQIAPKAISCRFTFRRIAGGEYNVVKNSWGENWGDGGYFYMPAAFANSVNVQDVWMAE